MTTRIPAAILISGRGSNMMSLVEAARAPSYPAKIAIVISSRPDAPGLAWAKAQGLKTVALDHKDYKTREAFEAELQKALLAAKVELIALAGFMRLMTPAFVGHWHNRMINIHPSLLPSFKGLDTHERALAAGVKIAGCTAHYVSAAMDEGPIIAQAAVPVLPGDTPDLLAARVLAAEHKLYPAALASVAAGQAQPKGQKATASKRVNHAPALFSPPLKARRK